MPHVDQIRILREALEKIRHYPANGNSEPDVMAEALEDCQEIARCALDGIPYEEPLCECGRKRRECATWEDSDADHLDRNEL